MDEIQGAQIKVGADGSEFVAEMARLEAAADKSQRAITSAAVKASESASDMGKGAASGVAALDAASKRFTASLEREIAQLTLSRSAYREWEAQAKGIPQAVYQPLIAKLNEAKAAQDAQARSAQQLAEAQRQAAEAAAASARAAAEEARSQKAADTARASFLAGLREQVELQGKSQQEILRYRAAQLGVGAEAEKYIGQLGKTAVAHGLVGVSAAQATAAMRQLPAQITDIVTGLASGQSAFTVLIQQGGQLKDSFGGVGNALRALGSVVTPTRVLFGGLAGAVVALAAGYKLGSDESTEFRRQLILSGNAAGETANGLARASAAVGALVGGQAAAADAMAQFVGTGQRAAISLERIAEAAIRLERVGGPAVKDTVKAFADLAKDPLQASIRLNESTNFLTLSVYKQIKALEEQGKKTDAARVAQDAFASASISRGKEIEQGLGSIERGWLSITDAITKAKNALLDIGRDTGMSGKLKALEEELARRQQRGPLNSTPGVVASFEKGNRELQQQIDALKESIKLQGQAAAAQEARTSAVKAAIEADKKATSTLKSKFDGLSDVRDAAREWADAIKDGQRIQLDAEASADGLTKAQARLVEYLSSPAYAKNTDEMRQMAVQTLISAHNSEQLAAAKKKEAKAIEELLDAQIKAAVEMDRSIDAQERELQTLRERFIEITAGKSTLEDLVQLRLEEAAAMWERNAAQAAADGLDAAEYTRMQRMADLMRDQLKLRREIASATAQKEADEANRKAAEDAAREWERTANSIRDALSDAFRRAFESGEDFGTAFAKVLANEVKARLATAVADALAGQVLTLAFGAAGSAAGGAAGSLIQGAGLASNAYQIYNGQGVVGSALGYLSSTNAAYGAAIGTTNFGAGSQAAMLAAQTGEFGTAGAVMTSQSASVAGSGAASWASWAGWAALIAAGVAKAMDDYKDGFRSEGARDAADALGGGFNGWILGGLTADFSNFGKKLGLNDQWADLLSGATGVAKLFGRALPKVDAQGFTGTLSGGDFSGDLFADVVQKGGIFRSDKRWTELAALPDDLGRFLDAAAKDVYARAKDFGQALGLPADALASVTTQVKVTLTDDIEANKAEVAKVLGTYGTDLVAAWADAVKPLAAYGETTVDTIARVGGAIVGVNAVFDSLGLAALQASIDGGKAAIRLQDIFGGIDGLQQRAGSYMASYYTEAERAELVTNQIAKALSDVGLAAPTSRDGLRALVDDLVNSGRVATEEGAKQFAALMSVADAFAQVTPAIEDTTKAAEDLAAKAQQLAGDLRAAIDEALPKFLGAPEIESTSYARIADQLKGAGLFAGTDNLSAVLKGATKDDIFNFARAFVELGDVSTEAKIAVVEAASALADLKDAANEAAAADIQKQIDAITKVFGDLTVIDPEQLTLSEQFARNRDSIKALEDGLNSLIGNVGKTVQETLADMLASQRALQSFRSSLQDAIADAQLRSLSPEARVASLRGQESTLFAQLQTAADPVAVAQRLQAVILARIKEEAGIRQTAANASLDALRLQEDLAKQARNAQIEALREQISGAERLQQLSRDIAQFTGSLRFSDLSPLSFEAQRDAARSLFDTTLSGAQAGDENAQRNLIGNAQAYLQELASFSPVGTLDYAREFARITGALDELGLQGANVDPQIAALESSLAELQALNDKQSTLQAAVIDTSADEVAALSVLDAALAKREDAQAAAVASQIELAKQELAAQKEANEILRAQIAQQAAINKALIETLERLLGNNTDPLAFEPGQGSGP